METMEELMVRHATEARELVDGCKHSDVNIEDKKSHRDGSREITLRCTLCRLNLTTWGRGNKGQGEFFYVRGWKREDED